MFRKQIHMDTITLQKIYSSTRFTRVQRFPHRRKNELHVRKYSITRLYIEEYTYRFLYPKTNVLDGDNGGCVASNLMFSLCRFRFRRPPRSCVSNFHLMSWRHMIGTARKLCAVRTVTSKIKKVTDRRQKRTLDTESDTKELPKNCNSLVLVTVPFVWVDTISYGPS